MHDDIGTVNTEKSKRKGLHRYFHTSKADKYISGTVAVALFVLAVLKALNLPSVFQSLSVSDTLQLALLFGIFGIATDIHYRMLEAHYDK